MGEDEMKLLIENAKSIQLKPVISKNISAIGYDQDKQILKVVFENKNGCTIYAYNKVEPQVYKELMTSESVGSALSRLVIKEKERYKYIRLV